MSSRRPDGVPEIRRTDADAGRAVDRLFNRWTGLNAAIGGAIGYFSVASTVESDFVPYDVGVWQAAALLVGLAAGAMFGPARATASRPGEGALLLGAILGASYLCVPETDQFRQAVLWPVLLFGAELVTRRRMPPPIYALVMATIAWTAMEGAQFRETAYVGALFAWWALILVGAVGAIVPARGWRRTWALGIVATIAIVTVARTGAISDSMTMALLSVVLTAPVSFVAGLVVVRAVPGPVPAERPA